MAGNTIGTGAVVLTANADQLLSGLDAAGKATERWASKTAKATDQNRKAYDKLAASGQKLAGYMSDVDYSRGIGGGKGGKDKDGSGLFGKVLAGAAVGGVVGVGLGVAAHTLGQVGEKSKGYSNVSAQSQEGIDRAQKAIDRISAAFDEFLFSAAGKLAPTIEKVADVLEVVGFVGAEVFGEMIDGVGDIIEGIGTMLGLWEENGMASADFGQIAFAALRGLGIGAAYAWDTIKAGAGVVAMVSGVIVDGFGQVIQVIAKAAKQLDKMAQELPEWMRPSWIGKAANAMDGFGAEAERAGEKMQKWGKGAIGGFGNSADDVRKWFDKTEGKFRATDRLKAGEAEKQAATVLGGAFAMGSQEATSVIAKFQAGNMIENERQKQIALAQKQLDALNRIANNQPKLENT